MGCIYAVWPNFIIIIIITVIYLYQIHLHVHGISPGILAHFNKIKVEKS